MRWAVASAQLWRGRGIPRRFLDLAIATANGLLDPPNGITEGAYVVRRHEVRFPSRVQSEAFEAALVGLSDGRPVVRQDD